MAQEKDNSDKIFVKISEKGYPTIPGRYLVKFLDEDRDFTPNYVLLYYKEYEDYDGNTKLGFFLNEDCPMCAGFEGPVFHNKVLEYFYLPPFETDVKA